MLWYPPKHGHSHQQGYVLVPLTAFFTILTSHSSLYRPRQLVRRAGGASCQVGKQTRQCVSKPFKHCRSVINLFRYWESKLPDGYVPDDGKIENFIRTKYEMKRWVLSPQLPDPANLDRSIDAEERVPLAEVQKRSAKTSRNGTVAPPHPHHTQPHLHQQTRQAPPKPAAPVHDLLGGDFAPQRSAPTTATQYSNVSSSGRAPHSSAKTPASLSQQAPSRYHHRPAETPQAQPQQPKQHQQPQQPSSSLIGLDFGPASSRAPQAAPATHAQPQQPQQTNTRPDLKKSILSLYSTPAPSYQQPQPQQQQFSAAPSTFDALSGFGNLSLNSHTAPKQNPTPSGNNLNDLLGGSFTSSSNSGSLHQPKPAPPKKTNAFDDLLGGPTSAWASPAASKPAAAQPTQYAPSHVSKPSYSSSPTPQYTSHNKKHSVNHTSASNDEEWADFTSHTSTIPTRSSGTQAAAAFNSTSPANPMDEDLFANVWK